MKNKKTTEMWKNALSQIDEKYIAEASEIAPESESSASPSAPEKESTGNLAFVFAAAAAVIATFIGVGFFFKGTGIEPLSPGSEGTIGDSSEAVQESDSPAYTIIPEITGDVVPAVTTTIIGEYAEITTIEEAVSPEQYEDWFEEAEKTKETLSNHIDVKEDEIKECEKLIDTLKKQLETEKFKDKADYDEIRAELHAEETRLARMKIDLENLEADYYEQVSVIESNRKAYEALYPDRQSLTMEKLKELVKEKGKELTWSNFEQFRGKDIGSGLYIMRYEIDDEYAVTVGGVPTEKPWYIRLIYGKDESVFSITDNGAEGFDEFVEKTGYQYEFESFEEVSPFDLLGDCYEGQDGLFHVSAENWTVCEDYDLFREYFFGVWGEDYIIDDSEKDWVAASRSMYFDNFYKVNDNVLAVVYHGSAGGELRWLDMRNPNVFYEAYGDIGDFPHGFPKNEDGSPIVFAINKTSDETNEPEYGYLSKYRLKELSKEYGIPLETLTDIEIQTEKGALYHDSKYNFYPMYLVFEADNRLVINTEARAPYGDDGDLISLVFEKFTGKWERTVDFKWTDSTILKGNLYSEKEMPSEIVIPEGITEIAEGVFMDCTQIEKVTLPSTLKVIGVGAFKDCTNLKEINIPYGLEIIASRAFENCTSVYMVLPDTVTTIGDGAFSGCTQFDGTCRPIPAPIKPGTEDFTLIRPVDSVLISSDFIDSVNPDIHSHSGIDYPGKTGDNVYAAADGEVTSIERNSHYGLTISIRHNLGFGTMYAHLDNVAVEEGDKVSQGDVIGYVGVTGWTTGPHLHFTLYKDGVPVDPHIYLNDPIQLIQPVSDTDPEDDILYEYEGYEGLNGIIYSGYKGQEISSAAYGTVSFSGRRGNYGNCVIISHRNGYKTLYAHLDTINVQVDDEVTAGHLIGTMGNTGYATGIMLEFELLKDDKNLNPADYMNQ